MNCSECNRPGIRVTDTIDRGDHRRRYTICPNCGHRGVTIERHAVFMSRSLGFAEAPVDLSDLNPPEQPAATPKPKPVAGEPTATQRSRRYHPVTIELFPVELLIDPKAAVLLMQWWNNSRWSKHGGRAVWTQAAFNAAATRVSALAPSVQVELCEAGVEHGWQTLKYEYIRKRGELLPGQSGTLRNPSSQRALEGVMEWAPQ